METGFSHGVRDVNSTTNAAPPFWAGLQILFESEEFAKYASRKCVLSLPFTPSSPVFTTF